MPGSSDVFAMLPDVPINPEATVDSFRQAMRALAGGVAIVTVGQWPERTGCTATSVESLSVEPPRLLLSINESSSSGKQLQKHPCFGVNILRATIAVSPISLRVAADCKARIDIAGADGPP
jgi:flavin reductase (DIM6/NTAB) family NADH-FMN oxidoreductase RutF